MRRGNGRKKTSAATEETSRSNSEGPDNIYILLTSQRRAHPAVERAESAWGRRAQSHSRAPVDESGGVEPVTGGGGDEEREEGRPLAAFLDPPRGYFRHVSGHIRRPGLADARVWNRRPSTVCASEQINSDGMARPEPMGARGRGGGPVCVEACNSG